jgi:hypothetical protein
MFTIALFATALAQNTAGNDPATLNQAMIFIGGLTACAVIGNQVMGAMINFRKLKGLEPAVTAANTAATEATDRKIKGLEHDMRDLELRMEKRIGEHLGGINTRLQSFETTLGRLVGDFNRSLGRLEGRAEHDE